ncbi:hypothetical protein E2C01_066593 [Portunus trituberculatus]|uniref:Uncharacterized protein n=1 Tax=Portunus trituberculatus TaxID=210409 RepID=A0A5B7HV36_PORTR|nr:hypothetical protein [Portunus trituberculatus]
MILKKEKKIEADCEEAAHAGHFHLRNQPYRQFGSSDKQRDCGEREGERKPTQDEEDEEKGRKRRNTVRMPMRERLTNGGS